MWRGATTSHMKVAYLGPRGTYSHSAALSAFPHDTLVPVATLEDVVRAVCTGAANSAVLPVENSSNGAVVPSLEALVKYRAKYSLVGEVAVPVKHALYTCAPDWADVRTLYSHPQVWGQVTKFCGENFAHCEKVDCDSTAAALERARNDPSAAAIASAMAGDLCDWAPAKPDIADEPSNSTRFLLLGAPGHTGSELAFVLCPESPLPGFRAICSKPPVAQIPFSQLPALRESQPVTVLGVL